MSSLGSDQIWDLSISHAFLLFFQVVNAYLDLAIEYDQPFVLTKYNVQQILGGEQDTEWGRRFLGCSTMEDVAEVFGKRDQWKQRQVRVDVT